MPGESWANFLKTVTRPADVLGLRPARPSWHIARRHREKARWSQVPLNLVSGSPRFMSLAAAKSMRTRRRLEPECSKGAPKAPKRYKSNRLNYTVGATGLERVYMRFSLYQVAASRFSSTQLVGIVAGCFRLF